ncbi:phage tail protein [Streptomyces sp. S3(2020)]|uniref:phage tail protein n=1 Tax=Streptomyces sp. S3(2020) TaxID=2732044 RepID=UPI00148960E5|nr:phage tail protein [Streptomyces sp. S3(2020)]NNN30729.1 phage tail protein [Streptomyces sp. S3(2020)]
MSDYLPPVVIELEGRPDKLERALDRGKAEVRKFTVDVGRMNATVKVKAELAQGQVQKIHREIERIKPTVRVGLRLDQTARDRVKAQLAGTQFDAGIKPVLNDAARQRVETALARLTRDRTVNIVASANTRTAADDLALLTRARRARVIADADTRVAADDLALLTRARTVNVRARLIGGLGSLGGSSGGGMGGRGLLKALIPFAPALIPIAAQATAVTTEVTAAAVAVGLFGAAIAGQVVDLARATQAETKYKDAVKEHGASSEQAAKAEAEYLRTVNALDPATREAAAAFGVFRGEYKQWTRDLAGDTMPVVTKSFAIFGGLLPKLAPTVRATSTELNRMMTVLAGGMNTAAFDGFMLKFQEFSTGVLARATDGLVRFMSAVSTGSGSGKFAEFMDYVRTVGPQVSATLANVAAALGHFVAAASQVGVSLLTVINAFAGLVNAIPTDVLATLLQFVVVFKLVRLAAVGLAGGAGGVAAFSASLAAMTAASAAAGGGLVGLAAAFGTLSKAAKLNLVAVGVGLAVVALSKLSNIGREAPPNVDKLTLSLEKLALTGSNSGESARLFGENFDDLYDKVRNITDPSFVDQVQNGFVKIFTAGQVDSTASKDAQAYLDGIDDGLAKLVQDGKIDEAAAALDIFAKKYSTNAAEQQKFRNEMDEYNDGLAAHKDELEITARAQGLFGTQAQETASQLAAQKRSADGLRQSVEALNDVNRAALGGMIGFEASIDAASKAAKENADVLDMVNGQLDVNSPKAQEAATRLQDLATKTKEAALANRESTGTWEGAIDIYKRGGEQFLKNAELMGLTKTEAKLLASQIMQIPDTVKMNTEDAIAGLESFNAAVEKAPNAKSVTLKALSKDAETVLELFGYKVTHLKNGKVKVSVQNGQALTGIGDVQGAVDALHGKTITIMTQYFTAKSPEQLAAAHGRARGGLAPGYADGGNAAVQAHPYGGLIRGPGTPTSDSIVEMSPSGGMYRTSDTEYIIQAAMVRKYGVPFFDALNAGQLKLAGYAKGGLTKKQKEAEKQARKDAVSDLTISYFGQKAGFKTTEFAGALGKSDSIGELVNALNQWRGIIKKATHGEQEKSLLKALDASGKKLIGLEKNLTKVSSSLEKARDKLDDLKASAAQLKDAVSSSIMSNAGIVTQAPQEGFALTAQDVLNNMTAQVSKSLTFANQLEQLKKRGLSADLLEQIAASGVEQGGATAAALVGADDATIKQLNSQQKQLKKGADAAGTAVADSMYGAGIKAAEGLVRGLENQQKAIEAQMLKIAKAMEASIKKALGIKSPSTVMAKLGDHTALGMAQGIARSSKHAVIAARGMAMSVQHGATLTGTGPSWAGVRATSTGGGAVINNYTVNVNVEGSVRSDRELRDVVEQQMLRVGMRNPATYPSYRR